jgi:hypothetical protein
VTWHDVMSLQYRSSFAARVRISSPIGLLGATP